MHTKRKSGRSVVEILKKIVSSNPTVTSRQTEARVHISGNGTTSVSSSTLMNIAKKHFSDMKSSGGVPASISKKK